MCWTSSTSRTLISPVNFSVFKLSYTSHFNVCTPDDEWHMRQSVNKFDFEETHVTQVEYLLDIRFENHMNHMSVSTTLHSKKSQVNHTCFAYIRPLYCICLYEILWVQSLDDFCSETWHQMWSCSWSRKLNRHTMHELCFSYVIWIGLCYNNFTLPMLTLLLHESGMQSYYVGQAYMIQWTILRV